MDLGHSFGSQIVVFRSGGGDDGGTGHCHVILLTNEKLRPPTNKNSVWVGFRLGFFRVSKLSTLWYKVERIFSLFLPDAATKLQQL